MNKNTAEARDLVDDLVHELEIIEDVEIVLCPPFTSLMPLSKILKNTNIGLGAQNIFWEESGAYTGEISPHMLAEFCRYVIIGHSERRTYFHETDQTVNQKIRASLKHNLIPIMCVGETLEENESGSTEKVITRQVKMGLQDLEGYLSDTSDIPIVVAYEPVWAIGTGKAATATGASDVIRNVIRATIKEQFSEDAANRVRVLYGGSVKGDNAVEFFSENEIDGALVGGASLKSTDFFEIVRAASSI
jgi:triosephosphate isomerase